MSIDHVLKLYSEAIRSPYLHYGFWDDPSKINTYDISLNDVIKAQERYIEHLSSFIPKGTSKILDVGAGIGGNSQFLITKGWICLIKQELYFSFLYCFHQFLHKVD